MATKTHSFLPEIITGLFVVAIVALLAFFTIVISGMDLIHGRRSVVRTVHFSHVGSLKIQDPVLVRGMKVGSVQGLRLGKDCVIATLRLTEDLQIHTDAVVTVGQTSLLGGSCLEITTGSAGLLPPDVPLIGVPPTNVMKELGAFVADLRDVVSPDDVRQLLLNLKNSSRDFSILVNRVERGEGFIGKLLSTDESLYQDVQAAITNVRILSDDLRAGRGLMGKLMREEDSTYDDLRASVSALREVSEGLKEGRGFIGQLLREDDSAYGDLRDSLANLKSVTEKLNNPDSGFGRLLSGDSPLMADLEAVAANLKQVTAKLDSGEGTLGHLVNDDGVATELEATIKDVRQIIDNMRDTAPITTFTSLFFGGL